jgi:hypothetical protein
MSLHYCTLPVHSKYEEWNNNEQLHLSLRIILETKDFIFWVSTYDAAYNLHLQEIQLYGRLYWISMWKYYNSLYFRSIWCFLFMAILTNLFSRRRWTVFLDNQSCSLLENGRFRKDLQDLANTVIALVFINILCTTTLISSIFTGNYNTVMTVSHLQITCNIVWYATEWATIQISFLRTPAHIHDFTRVDSKAILVWWSISVPRSGLSSCLSHAHGSTSLFTERH